jgi:hypothetical protein
MTALRRFASVEPTGAGITIGALHPAYRSGRSIFPSRVYDPDEVKRVLKTGEQSRKIGKVVAKGHRRGWPIFTLTLEERATCPRTCQAWGYCYGNGMHAAERIVAGPELEAALWDELAALQTEHPGGFMVRLHVLGDFYSCAYVEMWERALEAFPALHAFGFTARDPASEIGASLWSLTEAHWHRFAIRYSGAKLPSKAAEICDSNPDSQAITCPAQLGKVGCCAECALCWHSTKSIAFLRH